MDNSGLLHNLYPKIAFQSSFQNHFSGELAFNTKTGKDGQCRQFLYSSCTQKHKTSDLSQHVLFKSRVVRGNAARLRTFTKLHPRGHVVCLFVHVACMELEYEEQSSSSSSELSSDEEV